MKVIATLLSFAGIVSLCVVASQNTSSAPSRIHAPDWIHTHI